MIMDMANEVSIGAVLIAIGIQLTSIAYVTGT
jgi:hypothetical protein